MHVPLIMRVPGEGRGVVVSDQVGLIDLMPTVLDLVGVPAPPQLQGISLRSALGGRRLPDRALFGEASLNPGQAMMRADGWKYIRKPTMKFGTGEHVLSEELFNLSADPSEKQNRCEQEQARCKAMREQFEAWQTRMRAAPQLSLFAPPTAAVDEKAKEELRALGYGGEPPRL
jgi:arylsulfatase A-like enzyme